MTNVRICSYGRYKSDNYGVNSLRIDLPMGSIWFSYQTPIAFKLTDKHLVIRQNDWGPTTGKHLNWIDSDKSIRIPGKKFESLLEDAFSTVEVPTS